MTKPHVVVIMADQLRYDFVGKFTPNINRLLEDSFRFERAYCASPLCVPSRGAFFTGQYPNVNGSIINPWIAKDRHHGMVKAGTPNLYTLMENDWDSWHTGKQHLFTEDQFDQSSNSKTQWLSLENGYQEFLAATGKRTPGGASFRALVPEMVEGRVTQPRLYSIPSTGCYEEGLDYFFDGYILQKSLEAIDSWDGSKAFLLNAMFLAPHPPLDIPEPWYSLVEDVELRDDVGIWSTLQSPLQLYNLTGFLGSRYTREDWREVWRVYAGLVALLDHCVGQIVETLQEKGMYDDTLILFTSDHGEMLGSHCLWQKMCMYEVATRVPLAFKLPDSAHAGGISQELVSHLDVLPTLCDLLALPAPEGLPGNSLRRVMEADEALPSRPAFIQFDGNGARGNFSRCVVNESYKLIVDIFKDEIFFELYNVLEDEQEQHNLAFQEPEVVREMSVMLIEHMQATNDMLSFSLENYDSFSSDYAFLQER